MSKAINEHGIIHVLHQHDIDAAYLFAKTVHQGQVRKFTGAPYIQHPVEVARLVASVTDDHECIMAALMHDVMEDCGVTASDLHAEGFSANVISMVEQLSDISKPSDGNRAERKSVDRQHAARAWPKTKTVKLADIVNNCDSICAHDLDFAAVYLPEKRLLLDVLHEGDATLWARADNIIKNWEMSEPTATKINRMRP
ncbi:HD domain-containing protein [Aeromonas veronii]|uniref:HD domain-containing protein n=1 Tax=Aeromonas veronii TaxID=654 RepID=UPI00196AB0CC|nr:HD domain-containing protein [Aeromonas veronii]